MSQRITKHSVLGEIQRRIDWFEQSHKFTVETVLSDAQKKNAPLCVMFGRYQALCELRYQIDGGFFIGGFAA